MEIVTTCFGPKYLAFLSVLLRSLRQTNPEKTVNVIYCNLPESKVRKLVEMNPYVKFIHINTDRWNSAKSHRLAQKMDLMTFAHDVANTNNILHLDCDMIVRDEIDLTDYEPFDFLFTIKNEEVLINTGFFAMKKTPGTRKFIEHWALLTREIAESKVRAAEAVRQNGGPGQHALVQIIGAPSPSVSSCELEFGNSHIKVGFASCSIYNETNLVCRSSPAKILHYKGTWHKVFLEGRGLIKGDFQKYVYMYNLWKNMLKEEEEESGIKFLPIQSRGRIWFNETIRKKTRTAKNS
jgi:hypothetical protein